MNAFATPSPLLLRGRTIRGLYNQQTCRLTTMTVSTGPTADTYFTETRPVAGGGITTARGFRAAGVTAGFKESGLPDLAVVLAEGAAAVGAGVFTKNYFRAVPVDLAERALEESGGQVRGIVVNSGQANAATGARGADDAVRTIKAAAAAADCDENEVIIASTGVIGKRYDIKLMEAALPGAIAAASGAGGREGGARDAAQAIMTTDLVRKEAAFEKEIDGVTVRVGGMCKGSGMIHPDMATMLGFVTCDAAVERGVWQGMVSRAANASFNMITVDGDTSTNDVLVALCSGASGLPEVRDAGSDAGVAVEGLLTATCVMLAKKIARDGEGATVLLEVRVSGADSAEDARKVARTVAGSHLFKAAVFGRDPNWGRIAGAAGRAGVALQQDKLSVSLGPHVLMERGEPVEFDQVAASAYLKEKASAGPEGYCSDADTVVVEIGIGDGEGCATSWGCDLSYDYVKINSAYTT